MSPSNKKHFIFPLLLVAAVLIYSLSGNSIGIQLDFGEDTLTVSAMDQDWPIPYNSIASLELVTLPDLGTMTEGTEKRTLQCGTWQNETWGEYSLCVDPRIIQGLVITQNDGSVFLLNYESDESTAALWEMFTELLENRASSDF